MNINFLVDLSWLINSEFQFSLRPLVARMINLISVVGDQRIVNVSFSPKVVVSYCDSVCISFVTYACSL